MKTRSKPQIILPAGADEHAATESPPQGWWSAHVELDDGWRYPVYFNDPVRL